MTPATLPITGYLDRLSARPGETLTAHVSLRQPGPYRVRLQRLICGDPNPDGPGLRFEDHAAQFDITRTGTHHDVPAGSYARIDRGPDRSPDAPVTASALICPGRVDRTQAILTASDGVTSLGFGIDTGGLWGRVTWAGGKADIALPARLFARDWYRVWLSADPASGRLLSGLHRHRRRDTKPDRGDHPRPPPARRRMRADRR